VAKYTPLVGLNLPEIENWLPAEITQTKGWNWPPTNKKSFPSHAT